MFSSNSGKFFFVLALCFSSACCRSAAKPEEASAPFAADASNSSVPFSTKEPETFQAEFVVTTGETESKIFVARGANRCRQDYNFGERNQFTILKTVANESFLIFPTEKLYAENSSSSAADAAPQTAENLRDFLTSEWLNQKPEAKFTRLGAENGLTKYAVRLNDSDAAETIVFVDERINLPVRQEFYSKIGARKTLTYAVEMKNYKQSIDENTFEIPKDYKKVSLKDLKASMRKENFGGE